MIIKKPFIFVRHFLNSPAKVLVFCFLFFLVNFIGNGNFIRLWNLSSEINKLEQLVSKNRAEIEKIETNIGKSKDPAFIERQAREKLDLVGEDDLVFIFPGDESADIPRGPASNEARL